MRARVKHFLLLLLLSAGASAAAPPPDAPSDFKPLIGEYRSADALTIYEAGGQLRAEGLGLHEAPLQRLTATRFSIDAPQRTPVQFELDRDGHAVAVTVGTSRLQFKDIGREVVLQIRAGVRSDAGRLRAAALAAKPPTEPTPKRSFDLVDLASVDPTIKLDIRYANSDNFLGFPLYERAAASLQRPAAEALGRVER